MIEDKALIERAANSENDWVRACILKKEPPLEGSLLRIAERARDMAANSLGTKHSTYAVALQNLGLYYDYIENDVAKAAELFNKAREVLGQENLPLAHGFFKLGVFHYQENHDAKRAEALFTETLAIQRKALATDDLQIADTLIALAMAKWQTTGPEAAISSMEEALRIERASLPPTDDKVRYTQDRLAILIQLARPGK